MTRPPEIPEDLSQLDAALRNVRFRPRASLGPELIGRVGRGERSKGVASPRFNRPTLWAIAAALLIAVSGGAWLSYQSSETVVDQCCFDFDGGGAADDGVLVVSAHGEQVRRIAVYEDRDGSHSFTAGDVIRFDRGHRLAVAAGLAEGTVTARHCCSDLDGGGPADDGLLLVSVPPDKVTMVALYERRPDLPQSQLPLR
ncbi:MAG TPA: hypothetical protein VN719_00855 [Gemmatimonadales bacterium]|jgi:hypothetical protein|nr:hypothetical protein [Gemmatimonadales bacterium]